MRVKHHAFAAASVILLVLSVAAPALADQANNKPCLCQGSISPDEGTARTVYVASLKYGDPDGDAPAKVEVYIDGNAYPMRLAGGRSADGTYRARLTLPPGPHKYYFYAQDVRGADERWPRYGAYPGPFVGQKKVYNRMPTLTDGGVYFDYGTDGSFYTFTVHYKDMDDTKQPRKIRVAVDGIWHEMKLHKGSPRDGDYIYVAKLPAEPHAYYFGAADERGDCVMFPQHGFLRGPDVTARPNSNPSLLDPQVQPAAGNRNTKFVYTAHYNDVDKDPAAVAVVYIDGIPHPMKYTSGKKYNGVYVYRDRTFTSRLHDYYYYFEDGRGGTCRVPEQGVFSGPAVTAW